MSHRDYKSHISTRCHPEEEKSSSQELLLNRDGAGGVRNSSSSRPSMCQICRLSFQSQGIGQWTGWREPRPSPTSGGRIAMPTKWCLEELLHQKKSKWMLSCRTSVLYRPPPLLPSIHTHRSPHNDTLKTPTLYVNTVSLFPDETSPCFIPPGPWVIGSPHTWSSCGPVWSRDATR